MKKVLAMMFLMSILTACAGTGNSTSTQSIVTVETSPASTAPPEVALEPTEAVTKTVAVSTVPALTDDFFTANGISLTAPVCAAPTQSQTEGPYYTPKTPERNSLLEEAMTGTRLILVGYVLDQNCQPLSQAWLDFWQADANGEYDNSGYRLRGHQFTDAQGRYHLETILPGLYSSRPIEHIHVKVKPEGGAEVTSQLYFPGQPIEGLTVTIEDRGDYLVGYFNFVVQTQGKGDY
jgi:protocatechuate 3,4-dioxygenase beta subunit